MIQYRIEVANVHSHRYLVTLKVDRPAPMQRLSLPVWIPGSYMVREFARHLSPLAATQGSQACTVIQIDKCTWDVQCQGRGALVVQYEVYAFDTSAHRLDALKPRLARSGLSNVYSSQIAHENDDRIKRLRGKIDRVLVDAPCSGLGTLRRNPDLKWRQSPKAIDELQVKQKAILNSAARLLKPGGRLVYATCSLMPAENEAVANAFTAEHEDFVQLNASEKLEQAGVTQAESLVTPAGHLRLWPHLHATDGFYAVAWEKKA